MTSVAETRCARPGPSRPSLQLQSCCILKVETTSGGLPITAQLDHEGQAPGTLAVILGDLNGDGTDDLVTTGTEGELWVYLGGAEGPTWVASVACDGGEPERLLAAGDVDADGRDDLLTVREEIVQLFPGASGGLETSSIQTSLRDNDYQAEDYQVAAGSDSDGDGLPELVATDVELGRAPFSGSCGRMSGGVATLHGSATAFSPSGARSRGVG